MKDLARFLVVLSIFVFGFSMQIVAMNHPIAKKLERKQTDIFGEGNINTQTIQIKKKKNSTIQRS